jgi:hypothetical protein
MKKFVLAMSLTLILALVGCGSNNPANINGNWTATLIDNGNNTVFAFSTSLVVKNDGTLNVAKFTFSNNPTCFGSGETESGSFALTGNFNGKVTGKFQLAVLSVTPSGNTRQYHHWHLVFDRSGL